MLNNTTKSTTAQFGQTYRKIPVFLDGLSKTFKTKDLELKPHQLEGLAYLGSSGKGIVAYDVGLGKTMLGICGVMQAVPKGLG